MFAHAFLSDITTHWNIPEELKPWVEKVCSVYVFNPRLHVHCCELTPSFECYWISDEAFLNPDTPDNLREKILDFVMEGSCETPEVSYFHTGDIERLAKIDGHAYRKLGRGWGTIEEVIEHARCNSLW